MTELLPCGYVRCPRLAVFEVDGGDYAVCATHLDGLVADLLMEGRPVEVTAHDPDAVRILGLGASENYV